MRKFSGFLTAFIFTFTNIAFAHMPAVSVWEERQKKENIQLASLPSSFSLSPTPFHSLNAFQPKQTLLEKLPVTANLPASLLVHVNIRAVHQAQSPVSLVLLEDVHRNLEAQTHISKALTSLGDLPGKNPVLVALEGAHGGFVYDIYQKFPDRRVAAAVADSFLKSNDISGPAHAGFTAYDKEGARGLRFWGVDDPRLYRLNVGSYKQASRIKKETTARLESLKKDLEIKKAASFSNDLLAFDALLAAHRKGDLPLGPYVKKLTGYDVPTPLTIEMFLAAYKTEQALNFTLVEAERQRVLETLVQKISELELKNLIELSLGYQEGVVTFGSYYGHLRTLCQKSGVDLRQAPHFDDYIRYVLLTDGINAEKLFKDVNEMETAVQERLTENSVQRVLMAASNRLYLMEELTNFALTPDQWKTYKTVIPAKAGIQVSNHSLRKVESLDSRLRGNDDLRIFESFYQAAEARNEKMVENLLSSFRDGGLAVLVAGGFHTQGLTHLLKKKGISFVIASPKITKVEAGAGSQYLSVFDREKTPLEKLFDGKKLFVVEPVAGGTTPMLSTTPNPVSSMANVVGALSAVVTPSDIGPTHQIARQLGVRTSQPQVSQKGNTTVIKAATPSGDTVVTYASLSGTPAESSPLLRTLIDTREVELGSPNGIPRIAHTSTHLQRSFSMDRVVNSLGAITASFLILVGASFLFHYDLSVWTRVPTFMDGKVLASTNPIQATIIAGVVVSAISEIVKRVRLDLTNAFLPYRAAEGAPSGITQGEFDDLMPRLWKIRAKIEALTYYSTLVKQNRAWRESHKRTTDIEATKKMGREIRQQWMDGEIERVVILGIGGSDLGARALHQALQNGDFYNELSDRDGPKIYFAGDNFDVNDIRGLDSVCRGDWSKTLVVPISKSGSTPEPFATYALIKERLIRNLGGENYGKRVVAVTGQNASSLLFQENEALKQNGHAPFLGMLPVPDGVGGRYSVFSPVGLIYAAIVGGDSFVDELIQGYADGAHQTSFLPVNDPNNVAYQLAAAIYLMAMSTYLPQSLPRTAKSKLYFYVFYGPFRAIADWFQQGHDESLGKNESVGMSVVPGVGATLNHSVVQRLIAGLNDAFTVFTQVDAIDGDVTLPTELDPALGYLAGKEMVGQALSASRQGTAKSLADAGRPNATLHIEHLSARSLGQYMSILMRTWEILGALYNVDAFGQPGVEAYKNDTRDILKSMRVKANSANSNRSLRNRLGLAAPFLVMGAAAVVDWLVYGSRYGGVVGDAAIFLVSLAFTGKFLWQALKIVVAVFRRLTPSIQPQNLHRAVSMFPGLPPRSLRPAAVEYGQLRTNKELMSYMSIKQQKSVLAEEIRHLLYQRGLEMRGVDLSRRTGLSRAWEEVVVNIFMPIGDFINGNSFIDALYRDDVIRLDVLLHEIGIATFAPAQEPTPAEPLAASTTAAKQPNSEPTTPPTAETSVIDVNPGKSVIFDMDQNFLQAELRAREESERVAPQTPPKPSAPPSEPDLFDSVERATPQWVRDLNMIDLKNHQPFTVTYTREHLDDYDPVKNPQGLGLRKWLANYRKEAQQSTAGIRGRQNVKYPEDPRVPLHKHGILLATVGKALVAINKYPGKPLHKMAASEVRYNSPEYVQLIARAQAAFGIRTYVDSDYAPFPIWLVSFLAFTWKLLGAEYVTSSHADSQKIATKDINDQGSQYLPDESMEFVAEIENIFEQIETEGSYTISIAAADDPNIDRQLLEVHDMGLGLYADYLKKGIATDVNLNLIKGMKTPIYIDVVGGSMFRTLSNLFTKLGIREVFKFLHSGRSPFFHGIGKEWKLDKKEGRYVYNDLSADTTITTVEPDGRIRLPVVETMGYDKRLADAPVGTSVLMTDPDGDRLVTAQIEPRDRIDRLKQLGIAYMDLDENRVLALYMPNQSFLMTVDFQARALKAAGLWNNHPRFIIKTTASAASWDEWAEHNDVNVINVPVGFKEIASMMRKIEKQLKENPDKEVIVEDVFGNQVNLGVQPRLLFAGEESGGEIFGPEELIEGRSGRIAVAMREKSAGEALIITSALAAQAEKDKRYLSDYLEEIFDQNEIIRRFDYRRDQVYYNESEPDPVRLAAAKLEGEALRTQNDMFFLSMALAIRDGKLTFDDGKGILINTFPHLDFSNLSSISFVGDGTYLNFSDKFVEIRPSGTDAKTKGYAAGNNKEEAIRYSTAFATYSGERTPLHRRLISDDYYSHAKDRQQELYLEFLAKGASTEKFEPEPNYDFLNPAPLSDGGATITPAISLAGVAFPMAWVAAGLPFGGEIAVISFALTLWALHNLVSARARQAGLGFPFLIPQLVKKGVDKFKAWRLAQRTLAMGRQIGVFRTTTRRSALVMALMGLVPTQPVIGNITGATARNGAGVAAITRIQMETDPAQRALLATWLQAYLDRIEQTRGQTIEQVVNDSAAAPKPGDTLVSTFAIGQLPGLVDEDIEGLAAELSRADQNRTNGIKQDVLVTTHSPLSPEQMRRINDLTNGRAVVLDVSGNALDLNILFTRALEAHGANQLPAVAQIAGNKYESAQVRVFSRVPDAIQADSKLREIWVVFANIDNQGWAMFKPGGVSAIVAAAQLTETHL